MEQSYIARMVIAKNTQFSEVPVSRMGRFAFCLNRTVKSSTTRLLDAFAAFHTILYLRSGLLLEAHFDILSLR